MAASSMAHRSPSGIVVGVDTHKDLHVARAKDELGRGLGEITIPASAKGYRALLSWSRGLGEVRAFGVEGSGCYGVGLARHLRAHGQVVIEVIRPNRQARRLRGKSDPADAEAAAAAVLSGEASGTPKSSDAAVEMIRALRVARSTANRARYAGHQRPARPGRDRSGGAAGRSTRAAGAPAGAHLRPSSSGRACRSGRRDEGRASIPRPKAP
jgi:transposase